MLATYVVVFCAYVFSACAGWALISAVKHLDPPETTVAREEAGRDLKLAS